MGRPGVINGSRYAPSEIAALSTFFTALESLEPDSLIESLVSNLAIPIDMFIIRYELRPSPLLLLPDLEEWTRTSFYVTLSSREPLTFVLFRSKAHSIFTDYEYE